MLKHNYLETIASVHISKLSLPALLVLLGALFVLVGLLPRIPTPWGLIESGGKVRQWISGLLGVLLLALGIVIHMFETNETTRDEKPIAAPQAAAQGADLEILSGTKFSSGLDVGVASSEKTSDWLKADEKQDCLTMVYPGGLSWGAVSVTVGKQGDTPRPSRDFSGYRTLIIEMKSEKSEITDIGVKTNTQPD